MIYVQKSQSQYSKNLGDTGGFSPIAMIQEDSMKCACHLPTITAFGQAYNGPGPAGFIAMASEEKKMKKVTVCAKEQGFNHIPYSGRPRIKL